MHPSQRAESTCGRPKTCASTSTRHPPLRTYVAFYLNSCICGRASGTPAAPRAPPARASRAAHRSPGFRPPERPCAPRTRLHRALPRTDGRCARRLRAHMHADPPRGGTLPPAQSQARDATRLRQPEGSTRAGTACAASSYLLFTTNYNAFTQPAARRSDPSTHPDPLGRIPAQRRSATRARARC